MIYLFSCTSKRIRDKNLIELILFNQKVIKEKKAIYEKNFSEGIVPSPTLSEIIANDYVEKTPTKKAEGLRDDLDDIDENDVGKIFFYFCGYIDFSR